MQHMDHVRLIGKGVHRSGGRWADLGSGTGAFTLALRDIAGPEVKIYSIDKDTHALAVQAQLFNHRFPNTHIEYLAYDFIHPLAVMPLDGILMANSLHFISYAQQQTLLERLRTLLHSEGVLIIVEYDADSGNKWVPYPLSKDQLRNLLFASGYRSVNLLNTHPSHFLNEIYSVACTKE